MFSPLWLKIKPGILNVYLIFRTELFTWCHNVHQMLVQISTEQNRSRSNALRKHKTLLICSNLGRVKNTTTLSNAKLTSISPICITLLLTTQAERTQDLITVLSMRPSLRSRGDNRKKTRQREEQREGRRDRSRTPVVRSYLHAAKSLGKRRHENMDRGREGRG